MTEDRTLKEAVAALRDALCDLEAQIDHWLDDAIAQEFPPEGWCGRVAKHIAMAIKAANEPATLKDAQS